MRKWAIQARIKLRTTVYIEAETADEAKDKFEDLDWLDDDRISGEVIGWDATAKPIEAI